MTLTLGIVSDTHLPRFGEALPRALREGLTGVDAILHCGDFTSPIVVPLFEAIAPFDAVAGNNDGEAIWEQFGRKKIRRFGDVRIGMIHGDDPRRPARLVAPAAFVADDVDAIVYGHSHHPEIATSDGRIVVNPGSPTDKRREPRFSYATLRIDGNRITPQLHFYDDRST